MAGWLREGEIRTGTTQYLFWNASNGRGWGDEELGQSITNKKSKEREEICVYKKGW